MEIWDLVDEGRNPLGKFHTRGTELPPSEFHVVVEIFTINADGRILLTQRDALKTYPLLWESTGGSITAGESSAEGAVRELEEETGIAVTPKELQYLGEIKKGNYFLDSYVFRSTRDIEICDLILQPGEVCDAKWVTLKELEDLNKRGKIVPAVWERYQLYLNELE
ncbi:MAG: NUDIX domain-containing protein [Planococcus donghaensis]